MGPVGALARAGTNKKVPGAILLEDPPAWWMGTWDTSPASEERRGQMGAGVTPPNRKTPGGRIAAQRAGRAHPASTQARPWGGRKPPVRPPTPPPFQPHTE